ncbi:MAG: hypothetical protein IID18_08535 [Nitrospinae bacterium]|nr:hypothetical protein [Nitrospinota bacterium]
MNPENKLVLKVVERAEKELDAAQTMPFTSSAFKLLKIKISQFITDLAIESIRTSEREHTDDVSAKHVEEASKKINPNRSRKFSRHLGIISGIFMGIAFSKLITIIGQESVVKSDYILSAGFGIIGAILLGFHLGRS